MAIATKPYQYPIYLVWLSDHFNFDPGADGIQCTSVHDNLESAIATVPDTIASFDYTDTDSLPIGEDGKLMLPDMVYCTIDRYTPEHCDQRDYVRVYDSRTDYHE